MGMDKTQTRPATHTATIEVDQAGRVTISVDTNGGNPEIRARRGDKITWKGPQGQDGKELLWTTEVTGAGPFENHRRFRGGGANSSGPRGDKVSGGASFGSYYYFVVAQSPWDGELYSSDPDIVIEPPMKTSTEF